MRNTVAFLSLLAASAFAATTQDFLAAIREGDLAKLQELSRDQASVRLADSKGVTPLHYATVFGTPHAMKLLIDAGAVVNATDSLGAGALHWSACDPIRTKILLDHGAEVDLRTAQGRTPLMVAATCDGAAESIGLLLKAGANVNARQKDGSTALIQAVNFGGPRIARLLLRAGADVTVAQDSGISPLLYAVGWNDVELVKTMLARGAAVNAMNTSFGTVRHGDIMMKKLTPLMFAAPFGSPAMIQTLLDAGADVKMRDDRGMTPLMFSVSSDNQDVRVVRLLIEHGSDVNAVSSTEESVLDWACKFNEPAVISLLRSRGAKRISRELAAPVRLSAAPKDPRIAAARSISLLQQKSREFFKESGCIGCHHQPMAALAVKVARDSGLPVDEKEMVDQQKTMAALTSSRPTRLFQGGFLDTLVSSAIGLAASGYRADLLTDSIAVAVANRQCMNGGWTDSQTVTRAPMQESPVTQTVLSARVLSLYSFPSRAAEFRQRVDRAKAWLLEVKPRTEYERAEVLLGLSWTGASPEQVAHVAKQLRSSQRSDGGWAQRRQLESDAYMTGLALRALYESGQLRPTEPAYQKGVAYLLRTQMDDGSWFVRSRAVKLQPYFQSGFPYDHDQWISSTATAYAAVALARAEVVSTRSSAVKPNTVE